MTIYVDDMRAGYGQMIMCHMIGPEAELLEMADRIGVKRRWYQGDHFDICQSKRNLALKAGAKEITSRQAAAMRRRRRETGDHGSPADAEAWVANFFRSRRTDNRVATSVGEPA